MRESDTPIVPRKTFFGNPEKTQLRISPDGRYLSFLAPLDGVLNVWVAPTGDFESPKPVTRDTNRGIYRYRWTYSPGVLLYLRDSDGDENWHVHRVDVESGDGMDLTPMQGVSAYVAESSHRQPGRVLLGINRRDPHWHDIFSVDLGSGEMDLVVENDGFESYGFDLDLEPSTGVRILDDGGAECMLWMKDEWHRFYRVGPEDAMTTHPLTVDAEGRLWLSWSKDRDTAALRSYHPGTEEWRTLAEHPKADLSRYVLFHPRDRRAQAAVFDHQRRVWMAFDDEVESDLAHLAGLGRGDVLISDRSLDDSLWMVALLRDQGSVLYYLYHRNEKKAELLCSTQPELDRLELSRMHPVIVRSSDGLELVSYLTLPYALDGEKPAAPETPLPMVLLVHGGPWARDSWGYSALHQWLANRGYFVLSTNFRGSTGLGKSFINAANGQWAGKMHEDLVDAVEWAVDRGFADPDRVAIMGGSYGGYATLVGLTFTPGLFACGVDLVGPSNLVTLLQNVPPYWLPIMPMMRSRIGALPDTEEGRRFLLERSPLSRAEAIEKPLLIGQGGNDPRVNRVESDQLVEVMQEKELPVTYLLYPDEGHGFYRPQNRISFFAVAEQFLAQHLGGGCQPLGEDIEGSSMEVLDDGGLEGL